MIFPPSRFLVVIAALCYFNVALAQNKFVTDSLDVYANREMKRWQVPGMAVAIVKDGKVVAMKGYGVREVGKQDKVDENTLFQIASNTKAFTATCVALLANQKKLSLDDKITKWLPYYKLYDTLATRDVTIRDNLCHRVGFKTFQGDFFHWNNKLATEQLVRNLRNLKPTYGFRARWGYFNMGFVTAGEVIKAATDTTWQEYMTMHLLKPLKMTRTSPYHVFLDKDNDKAKCYTLVDNDLVEVPYANVDNIGACASLNSCVNDLSHWLLMNLDSGRYDGTRVLPYNVIRETQRAQTLVSERGNETTNFVTYGLGWFAQDYNGKKIVHHSGGTNGFVTQTLLCPEEKFGIVVLTNTDANGLYAALAYQVLESYLNMPYHNLSAEAFSDNAVGLAQEKHELDSLKTLASKSRQPTLPLKAYTGTYTNPFYGDIMITLEGNSLNVNFPPHGVNGSLQPLGENNFLVNFSDVTWGIQQMPFAVENGIVKSVSVKVNDFIDYDRYEFKKK